MLLDTCVLSELSKPRPDARVHALVPRLQASRTFVSAITLGELAFGVARMPKSKRRTELEAWLARMEERFAGHVLAVDAEVGRLWGERLAQAQRNGHTVAPADGLIAATAVRHGLTVLTRDTAPFAALGAAVADPWTATD
ncbi:type II toxin-antitoxin system VapC family toxin [Rohdeia mirabilis]|uniref:type II toxin-antitoxin system VapC family toxin n=1 Tax=Rohdeia mirabilis TaxID=2528008 RepID=UPI003AF339BA